jgi:carbonic anhydrase
MSPAGPAGDAALMLRTRPMTIRCTPVASAVAVALLLVAGACSDDDGDAAAETTTTAADAATTTTAADEEHEEPHFTYEGAEGPEHWGELSEEWAACAEGLEQSPIDLTGAAEASDEDLPDIEFDYQPSAVNLVNNGHTVQAVYDEGSSITVDGKVYDLVQFHFHAASEHTIDGETTPLEVHLVHQAADESLAVVGVMLTEGAANPAYDAVLSDAIPAEESEEPVAIDGATVDAAAMLPEDTTFFHYAGSLTTPPCSEGVSWQVMAEPVELSVDQIAAFTTLYEDDARPVQPLGERELEVSGP